MFSDSVDGLCNMWVAERAEVASEKQLLKAAVTVGLVLKKNCPDMTSVIESAMAGFVNNRLTSWIAQQGGWVRTVQHHFIDRLSFLQLNVLWPHQHNVYKEFHE